MKHSHRLFWPVGSAVSFEVITMKQQPRWLEILIKTTGYVLVAAIASGLTFFLCLGEPAVGSSKLEQLENIILDRYIGDADVTAMEDAAAHAMIEAIGDPWSYYVPAKEYSTYVANANNTYVGIGITVSLRTDDKGFDILQVEDGSSAKDAGILPGDIFYAVDGKTVAELGADEAKARVRGEEGTTVSITILRGEEQKEFTVTRKTINVEVARGDMLPGNVGLVTINNFERRCAQETIDAIEKLKEQGATAFIFDVRNNPGGYRSELVKVLDYLLPEGDLFRSLDYAGNESVDRSDEACLEMPMVVLINGRSYSAAEFFAAALVEYDRAVTVGEATTGKGRFQHSILLKDGSAVHLSVGKYFTPKGVSLAEVGGLKPSHSVEVSEEEDALIYGNLLEPEKDPQIQVALQILQTP